MTKQTLQDRLNSLRDNRKEVEGALDEVVARHNELQNALVGLDHRIDEITILLEHFDDNEPNKQEGGEKNEAGKNETD